MNMRPLGDRVLIDVIEKEDMTAGGLYIPDAAKEKPQLGIVLKVGPGTSDKEMTLNEGDKVLFGKYAGTEVELEDKKYLIMREDDILLAMENVEAPENIDSKE